MTSEEQRREGLAWSLYSDYERARAEVVANPEVSTQQKAVVEAELLAALETAERSYGIEGIISGGSGSRDPAGEGGEA